MIGVQRGPLAHKRRVAVMADDGDCVSARCPRISSLPRIPSVLGIAASLAAVLPDLASVGDFKLVGAIALGACTLFHINPLSVGHALGS